MDIINILKDELGIKRTQAETAVKLIDEGNTIPFIARYRKEMTGSLDDETLRNLDERLKYLRNLQDRKDAVLKSIEEQGKLSEELKKQIEEAVTLVSCGRSVPSVQAEKTDESHDCKGEKGLEPLSKFDSLAGDQMSHQRKMPKHVRRSEEKAWKHREEALQGAK